MVLLATALLAGGVGGVVLAADNGEEANSQPGSQCGALLDRVCEIYQEKTGVAIDQEALKDAFADARSQMPDECQRPKRLGRQGVGISECLVDKFGIDLDAWKAAMADAKERIQAGEDRQEVMAEVLASFGIDIEDLKAGWADDGERPFKHGFRGTGGPRGWFGRCAPTE